VQATGINARQDANLIMVNEQEDLFSLLSTVSVQKP
jgi:hypothetical protein